MQWRIMVRRSRPSRWQNDRGLQTVELVAAAAVIVTLLAVVAFGTRGDTSLGQTVTQTLGRLVSRIGINTSVGFAASTFTPGTLATLRAPVMSVPDLTAAASPALVGMALGAGGLIASSIAAISARSLLFGPAAVATAAVSATPPWLAALGTVLIGAVVGIVLLAALAAVIYFGAVLLAAIGIGAGITLVAALVIAGIVLAVGFVIFEFWSRMEEFRATRGAPGWGDTLAILGTSILGIIGIPQIIEAIRGQRLLSGSAIAEQQRWELGIGGAVQIVAAFAGIRTRLPKVGATTGRTAWGVSRLGSLWHSVLSRIRTIAPNGDILGWGGFNITISKLWRIKRSFTPWDIQAMNNIAAQIKLIPELDPAVWSTLKPSVQNRIATQVKNIVMDAFDIPLARRPDFRFTRLDPGDYGWADWDPTKLRGELVVNSQNLVGDIVGTIVHEGRHYYQMWQAIQHIVHKVPLAKLHPHTQRWIDNLPRFGTYHRDPPEYFTQPIESDAESFGRRVIDLLPGRWPKAAPPTVPQTPGSGTSGGVPRIRPPGQLQRTFVWMTIAAGGTLLPIVWYLLVYRSLFWWR